MLDARNVLEWHDSLLLPCANNSLLSLMQNKYETGKYLACFFKSKDLFVQINTENIYTVL